MAIIPTTTPLSLLPALRRGLRRRLAGLGPAIAAWRTARAERQALLDVLAKPGDRLLSDAGLDRDATERRLDVSRISAWDRWQL